MAEWIENNHNSFTDKAKLLQSIFDDIPMFIYKKLYKLNNLK